jgi:hypothetical protein
MRLERSLVAHSEAHVGCGNYGLALIELEKAISLHGICLLPTMFSSSTLINQDAFDCTSVSCFQWSMQSSATSSVKTEVASTRVMSLLCTFIRIANKKFPVVTSQTLADSLDAKVKCAVSILDNFSVGTSFKSNQCSKYLQCKVLGELLYNFQSRNLRRIATGKLEKFHSRVTQVCF